MSEVERVTAPYVFAFAMMCGIAHAQDAYPVKPIRIVSPAAGGGSDFVARLLAPKMSEALGQRLKK